MEQQTMNMEDLQKLMAETFEKSIRDMGLDKVDAKHGIFPSKDDPNGDQLKDLTKEQRVAKFLQAVVAGNDVVAKALSEGTPADGGYLVPTEFRNVVLTKLTAESTFRQIATVIPMGSDKLDMPKEGNGVTVYWTPENDPFTESNPTWGTVQLNTNMLTGLSKLSRQLFADARINIMDYVAGVFAKAFAVEEQKVFIGGDGVGKPKGLRTYTLTDIPQGGANVDPDDIEGLYFALPEQYRNRATWLMHNNTIAKLNALRMTDGAKYFPELLQSRTLLGRPVREMNDLPTNLGAGTNESEIIFGDVSAYLIGERDEMGVETTTVGAGTFERHQVAFKTWHRLDGQLGLTDGFRRLTGVK